MIEAVISEVSRALPQTPSSEGAPLTLPTWRRDPEAAETFDELSKRFDPKKLGYMTYGLKLSAKYAALGAPLVAGWGEKDKVYSTHAVEHSDKPDTSVDLFRFKGESNEEWVGRVTPDTLRQDETVFTDTPEHASQIFQIMFDMLNRETVARAMMDSEGKRQADIILSNPVKPLERQSNSGIKPIGVFEARDPEKDLIKSLFKEGKIDEEEYNARMETLPSKGKFADNHQTEVEGDLMTPEELVREDSRGVARHIEDLVGARPEPVGVDDLMEMIAVAPSIVRNNGLVHSRPKCVTSDPKMGLA